MPLLSADGFLSRYPADAVWVPRTQDGGPETPRIETALRRATGVIAAHLPWLLNGAGEIARPVPPRFADALEGVCADLAQDSLADIVTGSEHERNRYKESLALLEKINREYQGGLEGPGLQGSCVVPGGEAGEEGWPDGRFFKKGRVY